MFMVNYETLIAFYSWKSWQNIILMQYARFANAQAFFSRHPFNATSKFKVEKNKENRNRTF